MDSDPIRGEAIIDIIDDAWRFDQLPKGKQPLHLLHNIIHSLQIHL